jgi:peptidoglycan/LPS O-acetylase OafA/YrhL
MLSTDANAKKPAKSCTCRDTYNVDMTDRESPKVNARIPELDGLRGAAILWVLLGHYFNFSPGANHHPLGLVRHLYVYMERYALAPGWAGVDLFFVLSGFLIGGILLDAKGSPAYFKAFYARRFYRIIPIYYLWILSYLVVMALAGSFLRTHTEGSGPEAPYQIAIQLLFLQNLGLVSYSATAVTWFASTWSLAVEEQFYLVVPLVMRKLSTRALYAFLGLVIVLAPPLRIWCHYRFPGLNLAYTLMPCRADDLALGILAALFWRNHRFRSWIHLERALYGLLGISIFGLAGLSPWFRFSASIQMQSLGYTSIGIFFVLILLLAILKPTGPIAFLARLGFLREFGRISYCLYLIHETIRFLCDIFLRMSVKHLESWEGIAMSAVAALISYAIARASWTYFEHPLLQRGHAFKY